MQIWPMVLRALMSDLRLVRIAPTPRVAGSLRNIFGQGLDYVLGNPSIHLPMQGVMLVTVTTSGYEMLLLANNQKVSTLHWLIPASAVASSPVLVAFALSSLVLSLLSLAVLGFGITVNDVGTNIILQSAALEAMHGRGVAPYTSTRFGFDVIGGLLAARLGAPSMLAAAGVILLGYCTRANDCKPRTDRQEHQA